MRINKRLFQSKVIEDDDILSYHFKEQCKIQRRINATMPHLKSLHDQPSVRVKANGAIVLNKYHNTSVPSDWVPTVVSGIHDIEDDDDDDDYDDDDMHNFDTVDNSNSGSCYSASTVSSSQSFLSAPPLRKRESITATHTALINQNVNGLPGITRSSSLPVISSQPATTAMTSFTATTSSSSDYHFPYEKKLDILLEELEYVQQDGARMRENYHLLERRNKLLEKELDQRDQLIYSLQSKLHSLMDTNS